MTTASFPGSCDLVGQLYCAPTLVAGGVRQISTGKRALRYHSLSASVTVCELAMRFEPVTDAELEEDCTLHPDQGALCTWANVVFFVMPCAYNCIFTFMGGLINPIGEAYGREFWTYLNASFYCVGLPMSVIQQRCDLRFDLRFSSNDTFRYRMFFSLILMIGCAGFLIVIRTSSEVIVMMLLVGLLNAISHGTASQLVQLFSSSSIVALQTGFRFPDILALMLVLAMQAPNL